MQASLLDKRDHQIDAPFYAVMQGLDLGLWTFNGIDNTAHIINLE